LVDAAPNGLVFGGKGNPAVNTMWGIDTSVMSAVEEAWEGKLKGQGNNVKVEAEGKVPPFWDFDEEKLEEGLRKKLERVKNVVVRDLKYKPEEVTLRDAAIVRWASILVARRAAFLSGMAVAAILVQTGRASLPGQAKVDGKGERIIVGVDGSLVENYPNFERTLRESLRALVGKEVEQRVDIGMAKDGSGVGAALCALQALKQSSNHIS